MRKGQVVIEDLAGKVDYSDVLDALRDATKVYDKDEYSLSSNFIWSKEPDEKTQEFVIRMHAVAKKIERSFKPWNIIEVDKNGKPIYEADGSYKLKEIPNPFGKKAKSLVMLPAEDWAVMNRNNDKNTILKGILQWNSQEKDLTSETTQQQTIGEKVLPKAITKYFKKKDEQEKEKTIIGGE